MLNEDEIVGGCRYSCVAITNKEMEMEMEMDRYVCMYAACT